jgi:hypothetical protein
MRPDGGIEIQGEFTWELPGAAPFLGKKRGAIIPTSGDYGHAPVQVLIHPEWPPESIAKYLRLYAEHIEKHGLPERTPEMEAEEEALFEDWRLPRVEAHAQELRLRQRNRNRLAAA